MLSYNSFWKAWLIIGKKGADIENLKKKLQNITSSDVVVKYCRGKEARS